LAFEFRLPDIGEGLTEAEVVDWLVDEGQEVALDQPLVQIETDKAVTDIPSPRAGVLVRRGAPAGATVRVGEVLAVIGDASEGEEEPLPIVGTLPGPAEKSRNETRKETSSTRSDAAASGEALPLVRRLATDLGVDLSTVAGTGPGRRVTKEDVEAAARTPGGAPAPGSPSDGERVRLSKLRRTIAENMSRSWREIPHVTTFGEADATALLAARQRGGLRLDAHFIRAVLPALMAHPEFNASLDGADLLLRRRYDIGIAVDTPEGLMVVVVRGADRRTPAELSREIERLTAAARDRTAKPDEVAGQTFTTSNIGSVGGGHGTPIIPFGTTAILSFGRIREQPVVRDGRLEIRPLLPLSLSYDHRVIDGAMGRRFLAAVMEQVEGIG
jgi:pyruvate dehydrogenase E2 component (dihydrolipoyllysine-residue acetyltransferase)